MLSLRMAEYFAAQFVPDFIEELTRPKRGVFCRNFRVLNFN